MTMDPSDRLPYEDYIRWYDREFGDNLGSGIAEQWYETVTDDALRSLEGSRFWKQLPANLEDWNSAFTADHGGYTLFEPTTRHPNEISKKPFDSVINKSYRWNVFENENWPDPPRRAPSTATDLEERDRQDQRFWFGPHNWLTDFPDIFRVRLTTTYFDGVRYLADRIRDLAEQSTPQLPEVRLRAAHDGYHAAHVKIFHPLDTVDYENGDPISIHVQLEVQVTTTIQDTINKMLHRVYEAWRMTGPPQNWEWDHRSSAFAVNYLGSTLHYLEGMIVMARDEGGEN